MKLELNPRSFSKTFSDPLSNHFPTPLWQQRNTRICSCFFFKPRIKRSLHFLHVPTGLSLSDDEIPNFSKPNCPIGENNDLESVTRSVWTEIAARKVNSFSQLSYRYPCSCGFSLQFDKNLLFISNILI